VSSLIGTGAYRSKTHNWFWKIRPRPSRYLGEVGFKLQHRVADHISKILYCFEQRCAVDKPSLSERHIEPEIHLVVHFSVNGIDEQFITYFQWAQVVGGPKKGVQRYIYTVSSFKHRRHVGSQV
jgi:hypothetical protein